ncbi:MAG: type II toxin-antitoxin system RelE/ParE family toxin [Flexilinea sp.]
MILSFADEGTEDIYNGLDTKTARKTCPGSLWKAAFRKLDMLDSAVQILDLKSPPGNMLEKMKGSRKEQYSIRINDQYRICFEWNDEGPVQVEIVDYH